MRAEAVRIHDDHVILACFLVRGVVHAIDVGALREVVRFQEATPLPRAPSLIEGVIDLRGTLVPVVDLGRVLVGEPCEPGPRTRIAIAETEGLVFGLVVDAAVEVLPVEVSALGDPPALATQAGFDAARAVVRRPGAAPILVLSLDHVLESVYRSALDGPGEAS